MKKYTNTQIDEYTNTQILKSREKSVINVVMTLVMTSVKVMT